MREIAAALPGARAGGAFGMAFSVEVKGKAKGFVWPWLERLHPKRARVPSETVLAVRVRDLAEKAILLAADEEKFFTEPHYDGYAAVMVRLRAVTKAELRALIAAAWQCTAPTPAGASAAKRPARKRPAARPQGR